MNLLVIGGTGHVSGAVVRAALQKRYKVWTLTRGQRKTPTGVTALTADRHDVRATRQVLAGINVTWDLAVDCICYEPRDMEQDVELFPERTAMFVFISTDFVYAPAGRRFPQPEEPAAFVQGGPGALDYGLRKRRCEELLENADTGNMGWSILRPCHIYGSSSELGCLPLHGRDPSLLSTLRSGQPLELVGGGHFLQQPLDVDDLAATVLSMAERPHKPTGVFNVAGPDIIESRQYYQIIADFLDVPLTVNEVPVDEYRKQAPDKAPFLCHRIYDLERLRNGGFHVPATSIVDGLRRHAQGLLDRDNAPQEKAEA